MDQTTSSVSLCACGCRRGAPRVPGAPGGSDQPHAVGRERLSQCVMETVSRWTTLPRNLAGEAPVPPAPRPPPGPCLPLRASSCGRMTCRFCWQSIFPLGGAESSSSSCRFSGEAARPASGTVGQGWRPSAPRPARHPLGDPCLPSPGWPGQPSSRSFRFILPPLQMDLLSGSASRHFRLCGWILAN